MTLLQAAGPVTLEINGRVIEGYARDDVQFSQGTFYETLYPELRYNFRCRMKPRKRRACKARVRNRAVHRAVQAQRRTNRSAQRAYALYCAFWKEVHTLGVAAAQALNNALKGREEQRNG